MPRWCDKHIEKKPPEWIRSVAFRGGLQLCQSCLDELVEPLKPKPMPISLPPAPPQQPEPEKPPQTFLPVPIKPQKATAEKAKEEPVTKFCKCGCGGKLAPNSKREYLRGHKPKSTKANAPGPIESLIGDGMVTRIIHDLKNKRDKLSAAIEALEKLQ